MTVPASPAALCLGGPPELLPAEEAQLWSRFRQTGDTEARERLLAHFLPYAKTVAASYYARRLHDDIEFGDYFQLATLGMLESVDRFDPGVGVQFKTFAARRMHGAILNGLESMTEKQQQIAVRKRVQQERLASIKGQPPAALAEAAQHNNITARDHAQALFAYLAEVGVGLALVTMLDGTGMLDAGESAMGGNGAAGYYRRTELQQLRNKLLAHLQDLKPQCGQVVRSHYLQDMSFEAIACDMGLTKGRVSQIHREALNSLRSLIGDRTILDVAW